MNALKLSMGGAGSVSHPEAKTPELEAVYTRMDKVEQAFGARIVALEERLAALESFVGTPADLGIVQ